MSQSKLRREGGDFRIGRLRDAVDVLSPTRTENNSTGEIETTWSVILSKLPAHVRALQAERGRQVVSVTRLEVTIRYRQDLTGDLERRLFVDGQQWRVTATIDPDRRRRFLIITAVRMDLVDEGSGS
ncbi:phage head closure protein [Neorhodopirellula pilleata]|uniref:Phage head-tail joining protein n=1 Tax=Neorhodopirellula pilleata TaxID=2714738 RepID=A0A5C5ZV76_9BACT|nr:phage head closure protein [Neorhodopirellula pilleata]TWT91393.1 Phage head-tail joining protein [Neorhodopirellula pilleata]TWT91442.1 Phage head-tail joining protein [Neorhodopirellula pilleata]